MSKRRRRRIKLGDVYAIPLPGGNYAFAKVHYEEILGFYKQRKKTIDEFVDDNEYEFFTAVYDYVLKNEVWQFIKNIPFETEKDSYAPDMCVVDAMNGKLSVYRRGEIFDAPYEVCKDLEVVAVWDEHQIVDRLMGDDKWHRDMKKVK